MPDTGFKHGVGIHLLVAAAAIDEHTLADNATVTSDAEDNDVQHGCKIGVKTVEDDTGATDGNVFFWVLGCDADEDGITWQSPTDDKPFLGAVIDQERNTTHIEHFYVPGNDFPLFQIHCLNEAGQEIDVSINKYIITIPPAS